MVGEEVFVNVTEMIGSLPQHVIDKFGALVIILQAVGIAFIVYVIYIVIKMFMGFKNIRRLKVVEKSVRSIEKKLNILIKDKKRK